MNIQIRGPMTNVKFSIIMTVFAPWELFPRALVCLGQQRYKNWELVVVCDGPAPVGEYRPQRVVRQFQRYSPSNSIRVIELPRAEGCYGNRGRHVGLKHATGDYVCWVNHDNLVTADFLSAHEANIASTPGCVSVVGIDYWRGGTCHGIFPRALRRSRIDLLNFSVPRELALQSQAFGPADETVYAADWLAFERCRRLAPVVESQAVVGTHF